MRVRDEAMARVKAGVRLALEATYGPTTKHASFIDFGPVLNRKRTSHQKRW